MIYFIHNLGEYNLVQLIVMYAFMRNWSFQICLHMHPKSFDAGLISIHVLLHMCVLIQVGLK